MEYYFAIAEIPEKKHVFGLINIFDSTHFPEVQPYETYSYPEFRKKIVSLFKAPDLTNVNINELRTHNKSQMNSLKYMGRVKDNVAKAFSKLSDTNRQDSTVSLFCQSIRHQGVGRMTAIQAKGNVASALRIAASATVFSKNHH